jgi:hypothetical protein
MKEVVGQQKNHSSTTSYPSKNNGKNPCKNPSIKEGVVEK